MFRVAKHWVILLLCWFVLAGQASARVCDLDNDGDVDLEDITVLQRMLPSRPTINGPDDPRDPDRNGRIDILDVRACVLCCTRAKCSTINQAPFANAGPDQTVKVGAPVLLSGAASSDSDGDPLRYTWTFNNRPLDSRASLIDGLTVAPRFTADKPGQYLIQLIVSDGRLNSLPDTLSVSTENSRPVANAGPDQSVRVGTLVTLSGARSTDVDGDPLIYTWQLASAPPGSGATLGNPDTVNPTLLIDQPGSYLIALTVSDGKVPSLPDTVAVTTENSPPVANAGPNQSIPLGATITLDGSGSSDVDGNPLTFRWSLLARPAGSAAVLTNPNSVTPSFNADAPGTYVAQLIVNDGSVDSAPASVTLTTANAAPIANAGPDQSVPLGSSATLDGSASRDPEGAALTYTWSLTGRPAGSNASLNGSDTVNPSFTLDRPGNYIAQLIVSDGQLASVPDTVTLSTTNSRPVAHAGAAQTVTAGTPVQLDGSASHDADGDPITFTWSLTSLPPGSKAAITPADGVSPSFVPDLAGSCIAQLIVSDGQLNSVPVTVVITVSAANRKPVAVAEAIPTQTTVGSPVVLKGSASSDPDGDPLTWSWSIALRPGGSNASIVSPTVAETSFVPDVPGDYTIQLVVRDGKVDSVPTLVVVQVQVVNRPPVITSTAVTTATVGQPYSYAAQAIDPDLGDVLTWSLLTAPSGMSIDAASGLISWTPAVGQVGTPTVSVRVTDQGGLPATQDFEIAVGAPNHPPVITFAGIAPQWTQLAPTGAIAAPRHVSGSNTYDEINDRLITFGGDNNTASPLNDTWVLVNPTALTGVASWLKLEPAGTIPAGRHSHSAIYDPTANRLIIYGGCVGHCTQLADAWVLTHANGLGGAPEWIALPSGMPSMGHAVGYDPVSNRMIVFGGLPAGPGSDTNAVRVLVDANGIGTPQWITLTPDGTPPSPRGHWVEAAYDPTANRLLVYGGRTSRGVEFNDMWILHNANGLGGTPRWEQLAPNGSGPSLRNGYSSLHDLNSNRLMIHSGVDYTPDPNVYFSETWILTNANGVGGTPEWIKQTTAGVAPAPRAHFVAGYARSANRMVLAFGRSQDAAGLVTVYDDAWVLSNASGNCTAGQACTFQAMASDPDVGDALTYALDAAPTGMSINAATGAIVWTPAIAQIGNHAVTARVTDRGGLFATQTFTATVAPVAVPNVVGLAPEWAESFITAADLTVGTKTSKGGAITLNLDSLPSRQGWVFRQTYSAAPESTLFSLIPGVLQQHTIGAGRSGQWYESPLAVEALRPFRIAVRARVLEQEFTDNYLAFAFGACLSNECQITGLGPDVTQDHTSGAAWLRDNTQFHDYVIEGAFGRGYRLSVDGVMLAAVPSVPSAYPYPQPGYPFPNGRMAILGDYTNGPNARAEVTAYSFTQPRVVGQSPPAGTLVPNNTAVDLIIVDGPATETVPHVIGLSQAAAEAAIVTADLKLGGITSAPHPTVPAGQVSDQSPLPNIHVPKDTPVNVVLSTGPPAPTNRAPTITSTAPAIATAGAAYTYPVTATDPDAGDVLTWSLTTAPTGMTIDPATGLIAWTPAVGQVGANTVSVRVQDQGGLFATEGFTVSVAVPVNQPPIAVDDTYAVDEGSSLVVAGGAPAAVPLPIVTGHRVQVYAAMERPIGLAFDAAGTLYVGADEISAFPNDPRDPGFVRRVSPGGGTVQPFGPLQDDPDALIVDTTGTISGTSGALLVSGTTESVHDSHLTAILPDGTTRRVLGPQDFQANASAMLFDSRGRLLMSDFLQGSYRVLAIAQGTATPLVDLGSVAPWDIAVDANDRIFVAGEDGIIRVFEADGSLVNASFASGQPPMRALTFDPGGAFAGHLYAIDGGGRLLRIDTLGNTTEVGSGFDTVSASDMVFGPDRALYVSEVGRGQVLRITAVQTPATAGGVLANDSDPDGDGLNAILVTPPASGILSFAPNGAFVYTPKAGFEGTDRFTYKANDGQLDSNVAVVTITVQPVNHPPVLISAPILSAIAGQPYSYDANATDPDAGDALVFSLTTAPAGMTIDSSIGLISWIPTDVNVGQHNVEVRVQDKAGAFDVQRYVLAIVAVPICSAPAAAALVFEKAVTFGGGGDQGAARIRLSGSRLLLAGTNGGTALLHAADAATLDPVWSRIMPGTAFFTDVAATTNGIYPVGGARPPTCGATDGVGDTEAKSLIARYASSGDFLSCHSRTFFPYAGIEDYYAASAVTMGSESFIFATGRHQMAHPVSVFVLAKYDTIGTLISQTAQTSIALGLTYTNGFLYAAGAHWLGDRFQDQWPVLAKFDLSPTMVWKVESPEDLGAFLSVTAQDNAIFAAGYIRQSSVPNSHEYLIEKYDEVGNRLWRRVFGNPISDDHLSDIVFLKGRLFAVGGTVQPAGGKTDAVILELDPGTGALLATRTFGGIQDDLAKGIATDGESLYVAGYTRSLATAAGNRVGESDLLLLKYRFADASCLPRILSIPPIEAVSGSPYAYDVNAAGGPLGGVLAYTLASAPAGMAIDSTTGLVTWTPTSDQVGGHSIVIQVSDSSGSLTTQSYFINVGQPTAGNQPPVVTSTPVTAANTVDAYTYTVVANDPDAGDTLTYSLSIAPGGMGIAAATGLITWTPTLAQMGSHPVTVRVTDQGGLFGEQTFTITVSAPAPTNRPPKITSAALTAATGGQPYAYGATGSDPDAGDTLTFSLPTAPSGMTIDAASGLVAWNPTLAQIGRHDVTVRVTDQGGLFADQPFTITVSPPAPVNLPPSITSIAPLTATAGIPYTYPVTATDPDPGDTLTYSLTTAPLGMSIDGASGLIQWTPTTAQAGNHPVEVKVQDAGGLFVTQPFQVTVSAVAVCTPPPAGLVSWWPGEGSALDRAAANDGLAENGASYAAGLVGQAFRFDGVDDLIRIASSRTTGFAGAFSVEFWFNPTTTINVSTPNQMLLAKGRYLEGGFNAPVAIQVLGGDGRLLVRMPPAPALVTTTDTWPAGTWQHIALSWDGARYRLYVNGSEEAGLDNAFSILDSTDPITLGNADGFAAGGFAGLLDEPTLYSRALTAAEVTALHAARGLGKCTATYSRADAGPDQAVEVAATVTLDGSASRAFDGTPLAYQWTLTSRPANSAAVLANPATVNPGFVADQAGAYTLELIVSNAGRASAPDSVSITAAKVNHAPTITSTAITAAAVGTAYTYPVTASDPDPGDTLTFSLPVAPAGMSINAASGLIQWTPNAGQIGSHPVTVRVQDQGGLFVPQSFVIVVVAAPVPVSVPDVVGQEQATAQSAITAASLSVGAVTFAASDTVAAGRVISQNPTAGTVVNSGSAVALVVSSGPPGAALASVRVTPINGLILTGQNQAFAATGILANGSSLPLSGLAWTSSNPAVASIDAAGLVSALSEGSTTISASKDGVTGSTPFNVAQAIPENTLPIAQITSPADGASVASAVPIVGTASDANFLKYLIEIAPFETGVFSTLAVGTAPVTNGTLATLDPTTLVNDLYVVRLTVVDRADNRTQTEITVQLTRDKKVGNFTLAFQDLNVPMAGIPISVVRSYDSRDKTKGDFGIGWRLDVQSLRLRVVGIHGQGWEQTQSGGVLNRRYTLSQQRSYRVAITLPDGKVEEFKMEVVPSTQQFVPIQVVDAVYTPKAQTRGSLRALGETRLVTFGQTGGLDLLTESGLEVFDPQEYEYTTPEGQVILISRTAGVKQIRDRSGNTVSFTPGGITHSAGKSIVFNRDGQGRITTVTDPLGSVQTYAYDINGDLASHTDAEGRRTSFLYNYDHGLIEIQDPRGIRPIRNDYDAAGRLIKTTDAYGKAITYTHDLGANREVITDRLGNATIHVYDDLGNVTQTADALGGVTNRSYDGRGNTLSEQDPLGRTRSYTYDGQDNRLTETDPLGATTTYSYNANRQVLTVTDALGRITTNAYDGAGNLTSTTDPAGRTTTYTYDARGLQTTRTDPLGNVTQYAYDASGNLTSETDPLGRVTSYSYDANGNRLTQTTSRTTASGPETLTTSFTYDKANRLTQTTHPDGSVTRVTYNAIGKQSVTTDALGRETKFDYDDMGRLTRTTYPDGSGETSTYDAEGRRTGSTDRAGRTTTSTYDALGRLIETVAPDGSRTSTTYDAAGQVLASTDARGNATTYVYDGAGRRTQVTDAAGAATLFAYDALGNQTQVTDARGNTVSFQYDANNRRTRTSYADGTFDQVAYDALGRQTAKTDQAGLTTQYGYDALGRLTSVTDALGQITRYNYDEQGNQLTQTDAEGRTTRFAYDKMGRRISRTLPLGQTETSTYDAVGSLRSKTDFNGRTTTYAYDSVNRLTRKTPDGSLGQPPVVFSYTPSGQRASMQDASGSTTYSYDSRDRLLSKATPQGTLNYSYDPAGNLTSIRSNRAGGAAMDYSYDARNRLATVTDGDGRVTSYSYDQNGNLAGFLYPNGVQTIYTYNPLNRLTHVNGARGGTTIAGYTYTLGASGNRTAVTEANGRRADYTYDALYRLTNETISADPAGPNGAIAYTYDRVGNRLTRASTVAGIPDQSFNYDFNDRLDGEGYDNNGNTLTSGGRTFGYDFENHLTSADGGVSFVYNGDGIRVAKTAGGLTTGFLVDDRNPTGYAQVLEEIVGGAVERSYTYGLKLISQKQASGVSFYGFDGHGSVRYLTDAGGNVTDTYSYEAFGNLVGQTGGTANIYRFAGEQADARVGGYYIRDRYLTTGIARFATRDRFSGAIRVPMTLHAYQYAGSDPVNKTDPTGLFFTLIDVQLAMTIRLTLVQIQGDAGWRIIDAANAVKEGHEARIVSGWDFLSLAPLLPEAVNWISSVFVPGKGFIPKRQLPLQQLSGFIDEVTGTKQVYSGDQARAFFLRKAQDPDLRGVIDQLYRPGAVVGDGSTADSIRRFLVNPNGVVQGRSHVTKGIERRKQLLSWMNSKALLATTEVEDYIIAGFILDDLNDALIAARQAGIVR